MRSASSRASVWSHRIGHFTRNDVPLPNRAAPHFAVGGLPASYGPLCESRWQLAPRGRVGNAPATKAYRRSWGRTACCNQHTIVPPRRPNPAPAKPLRQSHPKVESRAPTWPEPRLTTRTTQQRGDRLVALLLIGICFWAALGRHGGRPSNSLVRLRRN